MFYGDAKKSLDELLTKLRGALDACGPNAVRTRPPPTAHPIADPTKRVQSFAQACRCPDRSRDPAEGRIASAEAPRRPNIIYIVADDVGYHDTAFRGSDVIKTPSLDDLATSGAELTQFYAQPMCTPTRGTDDRALPAALWAADRVIPARAPMVCRSTSICCRRC